MYQLEVPKVLKRGDTIALISISGGRAGDEDMLYRYEAGKSIQIRRTRFPHSSAAFPLAAIVTS